MRATSWNRVPLAVLFAATTTSTLAAQRTATMPAAPFRGTLSLGDRVIPIQIRWSALESRIQIAAPIGFDDTTSHPLRRDPGGDTLLAVLPGFSDTLRLTPRLDGAAIRGAVRVGAQTGTFALHRVVDLPLDVIKPRVGDYRLEDGALFSVGGADHAFDGLTYIHFGNGRTGSLFAVDSNHFVAGPRRYDSDPVTFTVQFQPEGRIQLTTADGRRSRGRRTVLYTEQDVTFPTTGGVQLAGTFTLPTAGGKGLHPAVIMLHGSEPNYRFRGNVVTFFASRGVAVLTWDKRGNFGSGGSLATATIDTMAADGEAAIRWLRAQPGIDPRRVGVWGISQGGWPASILAARDSTLAFVILHAGSSLTPAVQGEDEMRMLVRERRGTEADVDGVLEYYHRYNEVRAGRASRASLDSLYQALRAGNRFIWSPQNVTSERSRWLAGINDFDPVPYWSRAHVPVLALFGEFDGYVTPERNVPVLREAFVRSGNRDTSIVVFPHANHRFEESSRRVSNDWVIGSRYLPEYYSTMAAWLDRQLGGGK